MGTMIEQPQDRIDAALNELRKASQELASRPRRLIGGLNQALRRLRIFENEKQWSAALLDACSPFASRAAVFSVNVRTLKLEAARGIAKPLQQPLAIASAPAFAAALESAEPSVALRLASEMSPELASIFGEDPASSFTVFPITAGVRVAGMIYAENPDAPAVDLIATVAGALLESRNGSASASPASGIVGIAAAVSARSPATEVLHLQARRFARRVVSEIVLDHTGTLESGRTSQNIYAVFKPQIDSGRQEYVKRFLDKESIETDYLHRELIRTLGRNDEALLGPDYPGSLV